VESSSDEVESDEDHGEKEHDLEEVGSSFPILSLSHLSILILTFLIHTA
jgi:hypothetical protein